MSRSQPTMSAAVISANASRSYAPPALTVIGALAELTRDVTYIRGGGELGPKGPGKTP